VQVVLQTLKLWIWSGISAGSTGPWSWTTRWMSAPVGLVKPGPNNAPDVSPTKRCAPKSGPVTTDDVTGGIEDRRAGRWVSEVALAAVQAEAPCSARRRIVEDHPPNGHRVSGLNRRAADIAAQPLAMRAYHAARGALPGDVPALDLVIAAARDAEERQLHRQAVGLLQCALSLTPAPMPERARLLDELAWQAGCVGDHVAGVPALLELEALVRGDADAMAGAKMRLASLLAWGPGDLDAAHRAVGEAIEILESAGAGVRHAAALNEPAWIDGARGDLCPGAR
jgi:hypothetical protein